MGAYAIRNDKPIITNKPLTGRKVDEAYKKKIEYMDSHVFSFSLTGNKTEIHINIQNKQG